MHASGHDRELTLREARSRYFARGGFGTDGGYSARWVTGRMGRIPFAFPNTKQRVRAVRYHDLHHVLTGYSTDFEGECEISAWEIGSGCADHLAAWSINLAGLFLGLFFDAKAVHRAFLRGRRSRNLYRTPFDDALLERRVGEVRDALGLGEATASADAPALADRLAFVGWLLVGAVEVAALCLLLLGAALAPLAGVAWLALRFSG